jgi:hypothetical protein
MPSVRGTQRILFRYFEVGSPAVSWLYNQGQENASPGQRAQVIVCCAETEAISVGLTRF